MEKKTKAKEPIRLREKKIANGNVSLYLDCYHNGKRTYEYLKLYLIPEKDEEARKQNKATYEKAIRIKAARMAELTDERLKTIKQTTTMYKDLLNKKVLVRSYDAGVYFGTLTNVEGETVRMENVRNIWHWTGANCLSQIANDGITGDKVSAVVSSMVINRVCQILPLSDKAIENLENQPVWRY